MDFERWTLNGIIFLNGNKPGPFNPPPSPRPLPMCGYNAFISSNIHWRKRIRGSQIEINLLRTQSLHFRKIGRFIAFRKLRTPTSGCPFNTHCIWNFTHVILILEHLVLHDMCILDICHHMCNSRVTHAHIFFKSLLRRCVQSLITYWTLKSRRPLFSTISSTSLCKVRIPQMRHYSGAESPVLWYKR